MADMHLGRIGACLWVVSDRGGLIDDADRVVDDAETAGTAVNSVGETTVGAVLIVVTGVAGVRGAADAIVSVGTARVEVTWVSPVCYRRTFVLSKPISLAIWSSTGRDRSVG